MSSAYLRLKKKNWYVYWREKNPNFPANGSRYLYRGRAVGPSKMKAREVLQKINEKIVNNKFGIVNKTKTSFQEKAHKWIESYAKIHKKSWRDDEQRLKDHINPIIGNYNFTEITPGILKDWLATKSKEKKLSDSTINRCIAIIKKIFNDAYKDNEIDQNPTRGLKLLKIDEKLPRYLTNEESQLLIDNSEGELKLAIRIALNTGMRLNEILKLKKENLNEKYIVIEKTKSRKERIIYINENLKEYLNLSNINDKVFTYNDYNLEHRFRKLLKDLKLKKDFPVNFHILRHTFATHWAMSGRSMYVLKEILGHHSIKMTEKYAHFAPSQMQEQMKDFKI